MTGHPKAFLDDGGQAAKGSARCPRICLEIERDLEAEFESHRETQRRRARMSKVIARRGKR